MAPGSREHRCQTMINHINPPNLYLFRGAGTILHIFVCNLRHSQRFCINLISSLWDEYLVFYYTTMSTFEQHMSCAFSWCFTPNNLLTLTSRVCIFGAEFLLDNELWSLIGDKSTLDWCQDIIQTNNDLLGTFMHIRGQCVTYNDYSINEMHRYCLW